MFSQELARVLTKAPCDGGAGMSTRPSYYSGRGATLSDLNSEKLETIWGGVKSIYGDKAAEAFIDMVIAIPKLSATDFLISLASLERNGFDPTSDISAINSIFPEDEGSAFGTIMSVMGGMNDRDDTTRIRDPFLVARGRKLPQREAKIVRGKYGLFYETF